MAVAAIDGWQRINRGIEQFLELARRRRQRLIAAVNHTNRPMPRDVLEVQCDQRPRTDFALHRRLRQDRNTRADLNRALDVFDVVERVHRVDGNFFAF